MELSSDPIDRAEAQTQVVELSSNLSATYISHLSSGGFMGPLVHEFGPSLDNTYLAEFMFDKN